MAITVNLRYTGKKGAAQAFAREKYDLHMTIERFISDDKLPEQDEKFIRK